MENGKEDLDGRLETIDLSNEYGLSSPVIFVKLANQLIPAFDFTGNGIVSIANGGGFREVYF